MSHTVWKTASAESLLALFWHGRGAGGEGDFATVEIAGLDIYDPIKDEVKSRDGIPPSTSPPRRISV